MRYHLRTLLILLAVGPPLLAALWIDLGTTVVAAASLIFLASAADWVRRNTPGRA
jgi:hypothetical protein